MNEIRERAKWLVDVLRDKDDLMCSESLALKSIRDLLAELERVEKIAEPIESGKVVAELTRLNQRIAELEANLKHVQGIAKATMDKLPERWNMGFQAGLKQAVPHEKDLTNALSDERKARKDDNAAFTEDILRLEAENNRLNTLLHKASQKSAEDFTEFIKDARTQAARECVEIIDKYPAFLFGADAVGVKLNLSQSIKARFGLDG